MSKTKVALDEALANAIHVFGSSKFWITLIGLGLNAYMAYLLGGKEGVILSVAGSLSIPIAYIGAKTYQNTHGKNEKEVVSEQSTTTNSSSSPAS